MRLIKIIIILVITQANSLIGQNDTTPVCYSKYQHLIVNYNGNYLEYTSMHETYTPFEVIFRGFVEFENKDSLDIFFMDGRHCKHQYQKDPEVDTINTVNWYNWHMPQTHNDSAIFYKKIKCSYMLYKFGEKRLSEDSIKSIRLLFPDDYIDGQGKWYMFRALFYKDSTIVFARQSDMVDSIGRQTMISKSKPLKLRYIKSIQKELIPLANSQGYECLLNDYYPWILEYYDGTVERTFVFSNKCKDEKKLKKQYGIIIRKIIYYGPHVF